jgi:hypothetical protein
MGRLGNINNYVAAQSDAKKQEVNQQYDQQQQAQSAPVFVYYAVASRYDDERSSRCLRDFARSISFIWLKTAKGLLVRKALFPM